jgi:hypothetical protein
MIHLSQKTKGRDVKSHSTLMVVGFVSAFALVGVSTSAAIQPNGDFKVSTSAATPVGAAIRGMALSLTENTATVREGQDLKLTIEVRNVSSQAIRVPFPWLKCSYELAITFSASKSQKSYREDDCDIYNLNPKIIQPGQSSFLTFAVRTSDLAFNGPGLYNVRVARMYSFDGAKSILVSSNTIGLTVQ